MKVVLLALGVLLFVIGVVRSGLRVDNHYAALGLLLFSLGASRYFLAWPLSRDEQRRWRFNADFFWLSIYMMVMASCLFWLYRVMD